jgi:methylglyoxal synthase
LLVEFAEKNGVDLARSTLVGTKTSDATLARAIGADFRRIDVGPLTRDTS